MIIAITTIVAKTDILQFCNYVRILEYVYLCLGQLLSISVKLRQHLLMSFWFQRYFFANCQTNPLSPQSPTYVTYVEIR